MSGHKVTRVLLYCIVVLCTYRELWNILCAAHPKSLYHFEKVIALKTRILGFLNLLGMFISEQFSSTALLYGRHGTRVFVQDTTKRSTTNGESSQKGSLTDVHGSTV